MATVVAAVAAVALATAVPAAAQESSGQLTSGRSVATVSVAQSDPMVLGLGPAGLCWLLAGLLALVVGLVLATRRVRKPAADGGAGTRHAVSISGSRSRSVSLDRAGGAEK